MNFSSKYQIDHEKAEKIGNKIPHPFWLFIIMIFLLSIMSELLSGKEIIYVSGNSIVNTEINSLINLKYLFDLFANIEEIFIYFRPLSIVIIILMGVSVFQGSGALSALIRGIAYKVPLKWIIISTAFIGVNSNIASDVSVIVIPTLFAALYQSMKLHPWMGIVVGYAAVNGGWALNTFIAGTDVIISEISNTVITGFEIDGTLNAFSNWYFMSIGSIVITITTVIIAQKYTKKMLPKSIEIKESNYSKLGNLSKKEKIGLKYLAYGSAVYFIFIFWVNRYYINKYGVSLILENNIVGILFFYFVITGLLFGIKSGSIKKIGNLPNILANGVTGAKIFIVTALPASIFVKMLIDSNLGSGAGILVSKFIIENKFPNIIFLIFFIIFIAILNIFINSGSVKWLFIAPIAIPVFTQIGVSAEITQLAYRIGDSVTNCISPTDYFLPVMIGLLESYKQDDTKVGVGTMIYLSLPYSIGYSIVLIVMFILWYAFSIPLSL